MAVIFIARASSAALGVQKSLSLCATTVIPSLLPFMVITSYITESGITEVFEKYFGKACRRSLRLPGCAACIIIMSMVGGFPVGAKMISDCVSHRELTKSQGRRLLVFCVNGGPAFIINTVGSFMLGSKKAGTILLVSLYLANFIGAFFTRFFDDKTLPEKETRIYSSGSALVNAVSGSIKSIISICGWIIVFGSVQQIIADTNINHELKLWVSMFFEVTGGCSSVAGTLPLPILAFVLGFSGFAVHAQILPYLNNCEMDYKLFFATRIITGALAMVIAILLFNIFPCSVSVFASNSKVIPIAFSVSAPATLAMLFTFAIGILDLDTGKKV